MAVDTCSPPVGLDPTEVGPFERRLGLASVWVHTASGAFEIPALDAERARDLRVRIGRLARVSDEL